MSVNYNKYEYGEEWEWKCRRIGSLSSRKSSGLV